MIYGLEDGKTAATTIWDSNGKPVVSIRAKRCGDTIRLAASETDKTFTVSLAGTNRSAAMGGGITEALL